MTTRAHRSVLALLPLVLLFSAFRAANVQAQDSPPAEVVQSPKKEKAMLVQYLEVVTPDVEATCSALAKLHGVSFGKPVAEFGNARTAILSGGGKIGVRAPMADHEQPLVRPYVLVDDIDAAVAGAEAAGAEIALPAMEIPGQGQFAIYILGGIQHGLWQL